MSQLPAFSYLGEGAIVNDPHLSIFLKPAAIRIGAHARIGGLVKFEGGQGLSIGARVHVGSFAHLNIGGGETEIGDHAGIASGVRIISGMPDLAHLHVSAAEPPANFHPVRRHTLVGPYAVLFTNAVLTPGVCIGEGAVIGAGAVVTHDVAPYEIWAGCPARRIGVRNVIDGDDQANYLAGLAGEDRETVKTGILEKYGFPISDAYARDFVRFTQELSS